MQDAFAYCAELVRAADRDRFLAALFVPDELRQALQALYAFNIEVARVREAAREPMPGEIRLQWWRDVVSGERAGEAQANPVAAALLATIERHGLAAGRLTALIEARRSDLFSLAGQILGADAEAAAEPAGIAYAITGLVRAFPLHAARHQVYVPAELLDRHHVRMEDILVGQSSADLNAALAALRDLAREQLRAARGPMMALPPATLPAFLPAALVRPSLDRLDRCDAFAPVELSLWRRQWLIWRAARNPARIAGR
jgi:phytoene synthase